MHFWLTGTKSKPHNNLNTFIAQSWFSRIGPDESWPKWVLAQVALAQVGFGLSGIGPNGFQPKWHWPKCLVAEVGFGSSGVRQSGFGLNGFGRSGNKELTVP